ncbi:hypothetical protein PZ739_05845 [Pseudomonas kermanshahensis]|uniref:hypothetical protein n=1 Tax=Pseudomonas kermanshahensis TaxID=2745482 RepID=UPI0023DBA082|nr:hypothetical protein [Pseudomonas kermanshahensis]WEL56690.1 hypothetical protein PZ739_05845 [Pseudomonas kermanshahensis]
MTTRTQRSCIMHEKAHDRAGPSSEHRAAAWLGPAGLYRTRLDAVRNFEQFVTPVSADELFELASKQVCNIRPSEMPCAGTPVERDLNPTEGGTPDNNIALEILEERLHQIESKGYTAGRDDQYTRGQLADAAGSYSFWAYTCNMEHYKATTVPPSWPWGAEHWKPTNQRKMLVRAGALILAEIARLDRQHSREGIA